VHTPQLAFLTLEYVCVLGLGLDQLVPGVIGLVFLAVMLNFTMKQVALRVSVLGASEQQAFAEGCVEYIWSGLGKQLQRAAGVAEAELEGDSSQPAAAACSSSSSTQMMQECVNAGLPADAVGRLRLVWVECGACLVHAAML
jgi:hypothetical protein